MGEFMQHNDADLGVTRREFTGVALAAGVAASLPLHAVAQTKEWIEINGQRHDMPLDPRTTLLDLLREQMHLTGTKKGCDHGQCGACTVLVNGRRVNSCLTLAVTCQGDKVTTIEGLGQPDRLHPMQAAFLEHDGFQCGYCTPGQICSAVGLLSELKPGAQLTDADIREQMSGNLCRCGAYPNIVSAVRSVAARKA
jgi:xanthine dehydrogenase YagT iron-sulfur-binding subunit